MSDKKATTGGTVSLDRLRAVLSKAPPSEYVSVGKTGKRAARKTIYKQGILRLEQGEQLPVVIRNLSYTGCRLEFFKQTRPAGRVLLTEPSLPLELWADVVWQGEGACGLVFEDGEQVQMKMPELSVREIDPAAVRVPVRAGKKRSTIRRRP